MKKKKTRPKECRGCYSSMHDMGCNGYPNDYGSCPCNNCLVKSMCKEECNIYRKYVDDIIYLTDGGLSDEEIRERMKKYERSRT